VEALGDRIKQLEAQQLEAAKLAATQFAFIKQLEQAEANKVSRLSEAMAEAGKRVGTEVRRYAERLRQLTREQLEASRDAPLPAPAPAAPKRTHKPKPATKPHPPPQYGSNINPLKPLKIGSGKKKPTPHLKPPAPIVPARRPKRYAPARTSRTTAPAVPAPSAVAARFQQVDLESLASVGDLDSTEDAATLENDLAALHADVDSHLEAVLAQEGEGEGEGEEEGEQEAAEAEEEQDS